ncbi:hypothetical protein LTR10_024002 [Elasticomyces elasticus]|uniref:Major facilitator superfamily (MFS) profile domain-containing protein n=1 Tax=Exophiala sideris TaxID=1016849 RepID=A0ABR0IUG2_9EURO|nr:hypothetical protein LTR10_024002 [Elasticomyces elasticus]KAK5020970.1 hypothetical protein LTS07_011327 [Exophiala sideris]KAK5028113.1 hypothetical protein LTR13_009342 [Exophiala sideris]KAK5048462.1 hypothetical protein LTR69_011352 [Exophiala sideris]KAK5176054.1 hypothetical protein LTR44_011381 [Eurotiomycetes sp. CCFEE 6388]
MTVSSHEYIPGTVHLVDLQGTIHARHAEGGKRDIVLVPPPSANPDDPLNWTPRRKLLSLTCLCIYILAVGYASAAIYSVLVPISEATSLSVADLNAGTGYMFLAFGWGCLVWQSLAQQYGKRPVYLFSLLATTAIMIWAPYTNSNGQWIANKILQGFVGAPIESLCEISVSDLYFTHERGTYMGVYALFLAGSNFLAPYWCAIFTGGAFVILFFLMEETNFERAPLIGIEPDEQLPIESASDSDSKHMDPADAEKQPEVRNATGTPAANEETYTMKTYVQKLSLLRKEDLRKKNRLGSMLIRPFIFVTFPAVAFAGFMYGSIVCYFNILNGTASLILSAAPYNFPSSMVGLAYVACLIGVCIGTVYSGILGDRVVIWKARRNNGVMEPEHRLWMYCALFVLIPGGFLIWGVGAAHHIHWFGLVFAMGMLACSITIGCQIPCSYCIDCYKDISGDAMVTVIIIRNTMSFAVSYGITPWVTNMGYQNAFLVAAFVALAQISVFFAFIKWGRGMRKATAPRYLNYVSQMKAGGLTH